MTQTDSIITLFGATGYTGQLIAYALDRAGLPFRIAGRSVDKLRALAAALPSHPALLIADATQPTEVTALYQNTRLLINCAGPFTDLGERVIAQAALSGVHYLDITNELGYVFRARGYSEMAKKTGAALVPACGFEVAFADCLAQTACADLSKGGALDQINVVYALQGQGASIGTRQSAVRSLATSWLAYRNGDWTGQIPGGKVHKFDLPEGPVYGMSIPSCESITLPAHLETYRVDTWMTTAPNARFWAPVLIPLLARLSRSILRGTILRAAARGGFSAAGALDVGLRADSPFMVYVEGRRGAERCWSSLTGQDPYGLTAELIAYVARQMTQPDYPCRGLLAPSTAVDPQAFLDYAQAHWAVKLQSSPHG